MALDALLGDDDDFAVLDLPHEAGADNIERAGLGGEDGRIAELAQDQRTDAQRIADADQLLHRQQCERIGALDPHQRVDKAHGEAALALGTPRDQMDDNLRVGGRLKDCARGNELPPERQRIGQVAVMAERQAAHVEIGEQRLNIPQRGFSHRGIAHMANGRRARQAVDYGLFVEVVAHQAKAALGVKLAAVEGHDAGRFLPPVLQGVQPKSCKGCGVGVIEDAENAALLMQLIAAQVQNPGLQGAHARNPVQPLHSPPVFACTAQGQALLRTPHREAKRHAEPKVLQRQALRNDAQHPPPRL